MNIQTADKIDGWMSLRELTWLAEHAKKSKVILEVGSYKGRSARVLADNTDGVVYCCDPWDSDYLFDNGKNTGINCRVYGDFIVNLADHLETKKVIPVHGRFLEILWAHDFKPDFIFLDGDHRYETIKREILIAQQLMQPYGILAGHDYGDHYWPGVKQAVDELIPRIETCGTIWKQKL